RAELAEQRPRDLAGAQHRLERPLRDVAQLLLGVEPALAALLDPPVDVGQQPLDVEPLRLDLEAHGWLSSPAASARRPPSTRSAPSSPPTARPSRAAASRRAARRPGCRPA